MLVIKLDKTWKTVKTDTSKTDIWKSGELQKQVLRKNLKKVCFKANNSEIILGVTENKVK